MEKKTDLRILKTHNALCDTFLQMLSEKRFEDITVNELCDRAMIRRATFYKHFADKYDFFAFFIRQTEESFITADKDYQNHKSSYEYLLFLFRECINFFKEHDRLVESILKSNMLSTMVDIF